MLLYGRGLNTGVAQVSSKSGTADLALPPTDVDHGRIYAPPRPRKVRRGRRIAALIAFPIMLAGLAFGATYIYQDPQLQARLGIQPFIDNLPWKHRELVAEARQHPLKFDQMTLELSTRSGAPLSAPKASFTDSELTTNPYLKWDASFTNELAGLGENQDGRIEARFYDASGTQVASSSNQRFIGPQQTAVDFSGVALISGNGAVTPGNYRIALYSDDKLLGEQQFAVTEDLAAKAAELRAKAEADASAKAAASAEETKREEDARRLAMVQEKMRHPLQLQSIEFLNSTKDGTALSKASTVFSVSKVLFIGWRTVFDNRLYGLDANQYRIDAAYVAPDGSTLGSVNDIQTVQRTQQRVVFSGRVGNSAGGAFLPGQYTVNFYLNGQYFAQRKFRVIADAALPSSGGYSGSGGGYSRSTLGSAGGATAFDVPTLATGRIEGIGGHGSAGMELRLRPQPNGFLDGEMVVELAGYGPTLLRGFVRGDNLQFSVAYGANTFDFEGRRRGDSMSGTFDGTSSGEHGTWSAHAN